MSNFLTTFRAVDHLLLAGACIAALAWIVTRILSDVADEARVTGDLLLCGDWDDDGMTPDPARQERANDIARDTRAAFEDALNGGLGFDPDAVDWTQRSGR